VEEPAKKPGEYYTVKSYRRAIAQACSRAFPLPAELGPQIVDGERETIRQWRSRLNPEQRARIKAFYKTYHWHPHQLRHTAATFIRREFGLEAAQIALGHSSALVTEAVYAERDAAKVEQIMLKIG
jgi:integrase